MSDSTAVSKRDERQMRLTPEMERMDALARQAQALASASIVPKEYQGSPGNCLLAIDVANRTGIPILAVLQNLYLIHGRPSWSAKFLIGAVNACGRFTPLRYQTEGEESRPGWRCRAYATSREDGDLLEGPWVTWEMVQAEGWSTKSGSKWKTMPDLMMRYRSAAFWARVYAPDISLGLMTADEARDIPSPAKAKAEILAAALDEVEEAEAEVVEPTPEEGLFAEVDHV